MGRYSTPFGYRLTTPPVTLTTLPFPVATFRTYHHGLHRYTPIRHGFHTFLLFVTHAGMPGSRCGGVDKLWFLWTSDWMYCAGILGVRSSPVSDWIPLCSGLVYLPHSLPLVDTGLQHTHVNPLPYSPTPQAQRTHFPLFDPTAFPHLPAATLLAPTHALLFHHCAVTVALLTVLTCTFPVRHHHPRLPFGMPISLGVYGVTTLYRPLTFCAIRLGMTILYGFFSSPFSVYRYLINVDGCDRGSPRSTCQPPDLHASRTNATPY